MTVTNAYASRQWTAAGRVTAGKLTGGFRSGSSLSDDGFGNDTASVIHQTFIGMGGDLKLKNRPTRFLYRAFPPDTNVVGGNL